MAGRVSLNHDGFFVPNAQDVTRPELAEPDRIDFNTVAHARWGVINGCLVTVTNSLATVTAGTALVNGKLVNVAAGQSARVGAGGPQDRFDLVCVDQTGTLIGVPGLESLDPVFPDPDINSTVLAAVLCTAGGGDYSGNVVDKRKFLPDSLLTKIPPTNDLLANRNGSGNLFKVLGDGTMTWNDDTTLKRSDIGVLQIIASLKIDNTLVTGGGITTKELVATNRVIGSNLRTGTAKPADTNGNTGDLFANSGDGTFYIYKNNAWKELATIEAAVPMGTIISSLRPAADMTPMGWVPLDGVTQVSEQTQGALFTLLDSLGWQRSGVSPNRSITTKNVTKRVMMVTGEAPGTFGGSTAIALGVNNLPKHSHNVVTKNDGGHSHVVDAIPAGHHTHSVTKGAHSHNEVPDNGHQHAGTDRADGGQFIVRADTGYNKLDALFNDRSHTYSVEPMLWTKSAKTGIQYIGPGGSDHTHEVGSAPDHDHTVTVRSAGTHVHDIDEDPVGLGTALPFTPAYLAVNYFIKS